VSSGEAPDPAPAHGPVRPAIAVAIGAVSYAALAILGFGLLSLALGRDVIEVRDLGQVPGILGMLVSIALVALALWVAVRRPRPSYAGTIGVVVAAYLGYLLGVVAGAILTGTGPAAAIAAASGVAVSWFGVALAAAGLVAGWGGIALARTRADRPHWPWEDDADD
jgi:FtsH-binding integral membrane protein